MNEATDSRAAKYFVAGVATLRATAPILPTEKQQAKNTALAFCGLTSIV
jgi:hypothetical protein